MPRKSKPLRNPPNRLRELREAAGLSQVELGRRFGTSGEAIRKYEIGIRQLDMRATERMARIFGVPVQRLYSSVDPLTDQEEEAMLKLFRWARRVGLTQALTVLASIADDRAHAHAAE